MVLIISMFASCSNDYKNDQELNSINHRFESKDFENIGYEHNRILENLWKELYTSGISSNDQFLNFTKAKISDEISNFSTTDEDLQLANDLINDYVGTPYLIENDLYSHAANEEEISSRVKAYLDELHLILIGNNNKPNIVLNQISHIESQAYSDTNMNNKDLSILFSSTSVAKASYRYWYDNFDKWSNYSVQTIKKKSAGDDTLKAIGTIAGMDVAGAVAGAASAWAVNVIVGPGQAAYGAAIVGSAVGTSVTTAAAIIIDSIFDLW